MPRKLTDQEVLLRIADLCVEDVLATPDKELTAEMAENGEDPDQATEEARQVIERALNEHGNPDLTPKN